MSSSSASSEQETAALAAALARDLPQGAVVYVEGELGAGKTAFVQGMARGLGVTGAVKSPSFTIVNEHDGRVPLFHVDFYRLESAAELHNIGFDEYFGRGGVVVVEWADRFADALPAERLDVRIEILDGDARLFHVSGPARLASALQ